MFSRLYWPPSPSAGSQPFITAPPSLPPVTAAFHTPYTWQPEHCLGAAWAADPSLGSSWAVGKVTDDV